MIISKTPYRISFFGGGSDYPEWYLRNGGRVITTTINKYIYISCRTLPQYFKHKHRICYSKIELVKDEKKIKHSVIKYVFKKFQNQIKNEGLEIHYDGDFPSRSGVGSSSAFVVGLINSISNHYNKQLSKKELADQSLYLEQKILKETVGSQDQIAASYGGLNEIIFKKNGNYNVRPLVTSISDLKFLESNMILVFTGVRGKSKTANNIAKTYVSKLNYKKNNILEIMKHAEIAKKLLKERKFNDFGLLLNETWKFKRELSSSVTTDKVDYVYNLGIKNGALGGKLLGAGGAGFFLFYLPKNKRELFLNSFKNFTCIPFKFEQEGSTIIFNEKK
jgi:D-glycero-alpha-D-manno-heptose-7-phosphate kinase